MIYLVAFVVAVLATARLTRLVQKDDLTLPFRYWVDRKFGEDSFLSRLVWCHWCAGVWCSFGVSTLTWLLLWEPFGWKAIGWWALTVPAVAYAASWVVDKERMDL